MARASVSLSIVEDTVVLTPCDIGGGAGGFHITGTWTGTITFEAKAPGAGSTNWVSILATSVATDVPATTTTGNGIFRVVADGLHIRARLSTATSGTAVVYPFEVGL